MSNDLNRCEFIGRLGKDPESRFMPSGKEVVNMSIAVGESWKDEQGQKQERTTWVPIVVFGKLASICSQYLSKGSKVFVAGKFRTRKWQDQSGNDRYTTEIVASEMQMLDSRGGNDSHDPAQRQQAAQAMQGDYGTGVNPNVTGQADDPRITDFDEDIPF